ncbi:MAG: leucine-rich repeat protein, partial [Clostridia bacterium]|nr:leucine-rich repeat protein [Clostridia bacterium]
MKKILCTVLVVVLCLTSAPLGGFVGLELPEWNWKASAVDEYKEGYYTYTVTNGKATITDVDTSISGDITIPATLGGYTVTAIGTYAFTWCGSLASVTIPNSITTIGEESFCYCTSLTNITVDKDNTVYSSDSKGVLFDKNKTLLLQYPIANANISYIIPDSVTTIGAFAFGYCNSLTNLIIPDSVTIISNYAFRDCDNLASITIPDSVTTIDNGAFFNCDSLASVTIPDSVTTIGYSAFVYCDSLTSVTIPNSVTTIGECTFFNCDGLASVTIPDSVTTIGVDAFGDCDNLTDVYYVGIEEQWNNIIIEGNNDELLDATIHFLGEDEPDEPKPDGYKLKLWSDGAYSDSIAVGESIGFDVYLLENGKYLDCERPYAVSFDVPGVFEVSQIKRSTDSMYIKLIAMKPGTTNMTISDSVTGAYVTVKLKADNKIKALTLYEFDDSAKEQDDILTHLYNQNGIYINGFNVNENRDGSYHVVMNAYNEKAHYGAVVAYDKDGNITDYDLIKQKKKLPTNLWSGTFDVFDWVTYKFEVFGEKPYTHLGCTQWTPIDIKVPKDGHLVITNNTANEMAFLANMTDLAMDFAFAYVDFIFADIPEDTSDEVVKL